MRVGLISDTHGLMRPEALEALAGSERIIHAGDIGSADVLEALARIAPVTAIRGNNDTAEWARAIRETTVVQLGGLSILVLHDVNTLSRDAARAHDVVVAGHSHRPRVERNGEVLFVNPGSAGPRRFSLPISVGHLVIDGTHADAEIHELRIAAQGAPTKQRRR